MTTTFIYPITGFVEKTFVITEFELRKLRHDFTELITRALQPALWLLIFGQVFSRSGAMHTGNIPYLDFIAPGILAQSVLFVAIFYGINVIWERDLGIVQKFLASPTPRAALVLGKGFSAGVRSLSQALHPVMLDEVGLEATLDSYIPTVERQTGIAISYEKQGAPFAIDGSASVQIYRIVQEALNNVARHSGTKQAWVRLRFLPAALELDVEDHGVGFSGRPAKLGIGLVAMRERSELMGGRIVFLNPAAGGTLLHLTVPRERVESREKDQR